MKHLSLAEAGGLNLGGFRDFFGVTIFADAWMSAELLGVGCTAA